MTNKKSKSPYIILPFNFIRLGQKYVLIINFVGEYIYLSENDFNCLVAHSLNRSSALYLNLKAKHFITESLSDPAIELLSIKYRTKKRYLLDFTSLHIFVITQRCNQKCIYCQVSSQSSDKKALDMNIETAKKAVDITFMSPSKSIKIEFQGGEPLLNFNTLKYIVEYAGDQAIEKNKNLEFVVCTNLTKINDDMLQYFHDKNVLISTSLDGPKNVHDFNRRYRDGSGCYEDFIKGLDKARKYIDQENISALMTTTRYSLNYPKEIVDEYLRNGFRSIFLRPLNPFGYAKQKSDLIAYSATDFIEFYKQILEYIIEINSKGTFLEEAFTSILLTRILTPFSTGFVDLQFPAGTGISGVVYAHDGNVYLSDESRMLGQVGDYSFCMGNLFKNTYEELFYNENIKQIIASSCAEVLPDCAYCAFQIYCGIDPIRNYVTQNDIIGKRYRDESCFINKEIFKYFFNIILNNDRNRLDVFWSWITNRPLSEIKMGSECSPSLEHQKT